MKLAPTCVDGVFLIQSEPVSDERGSFLRTWCRRDFETGGLEVGVAQCSISRNRLKGTLRGMHYQAAPKEECKVVRCARGAIYDVALDLRCGSPTFLRWFGVELTDENGLALYVPRGVAHGFLTLADGSDVHYQISEFYEPTLARGVRWDDPAFGIRWPADVRVISERDRGYPEFVR